MSRNADIVDALLADTGDEADVIRHEFRELVLAARASEDLMVKDTLHAVERWLVLWAAHEISPTELEHLVQGRQRVVYHYLKSIEATARHMIERVSTRLLTRLLYALPELE